VLNLTLVNPATKAWGTKAMVHQACTQGLLLIGVGDGVRHYLAQQAIEPIPPTRDLQQSPLDNPLTS